MPTRCSCFADGNARAKGLLDLGSAMMNCQEELYCVFVRVRYHPAPVFHCSLDAVVEVPGLSSAGQGQWEDVLRSTLH